MNKASKIVTDILQFVGNTTTEEIKFLHLITQIDKRRCDTMKNNNQLNVPEAREAMDKFKMEAANDLDVSFTS